MKKIVLALLLISMFGCYKVKTKPDKIYLRSYVMGYYELREIRLSAEEFGASPYPDKRAKMGAEFERGETIGYYTYDDGTPQKAAYDALCEKYGDMSFNRTVSALPGEAVMFPEVDFVSIRVTSNKDYDAEHPAGTPLNDILIYDSYTVKPYIDSGYTEYDVALGLNKYSVVNKKLSDVTSQDLVLPGDGSNGYAWTVIFDSNPTLEKTHTFTVTMTADDDRVFTASIDMTF